MRFCLILTSCLLLPACAHQGGAVMDESTASQLGRQSDDDNLSDVTAEAADSAVLADDELVEAIETGKAQVEGPETWQGGVAVSQLGRYYFSGQPDASTLRQASEEGVSVVVNLREESEMTWDEAKAVRDAGMIYYHIPMSSKGNMDSEVIAEINAVQERHGGKILVHCATGARVGAWFASYLTTQQNIALDRALAIGQQIGMKGESQVARVQDFVHEYDAANGGEWDEGESVQ